MKRALVTGATGFIGQHALEPLAARGYEVYAVSSTRAPGGGDDICWRRADLLDPTAVAALVDDVRPTHLLHFAWFGTPGEFWRSRENLRWTAASLHLLHEVAAAGCKRVVLAGTCAEYDWRHGLCSEILSPLEPSTLYGVCKRALHSIADAFAAEAGLSLAWGRIFFVYGPHEHSARLVASVIRALLRGEAAACSHGRQMRDFLHVHDVASAFVSLLDSEVEGPVNVASGSPLAVRDLVLAIGEAIGRPELVRLGELALPPGEPDDLVADTRRLRDEVCWVPRIALEQGLRETIAWWRRELAEELAA